MRAVAQAQGEAYVQAPTDRTHKTPSDQTVIFQARVILGRHHQLNNAQRTAYAKTEVVKGARH